MVSSGSPCLSISPGTPSSGAVSRRPFHSQRPSPTPHSRAFDDFFFFSCPIYHQCFAFVHGTDTCFYEEFLYTNTLVTRAQQSLTNAADFSACAVQDLISMTYLPSWSVILPWSFPLGLASDRLAPWTLILRVRPVIWYVINFGFAPAVNRMIFLEAFRLFLPVILQYRLTEESYAYFISKRRISSTGCSTHVIISLTTTILQFSQYKIVDDWPILLNRNRTIRNWYVISSGNGGRGVGFDPCGGRWRNRAGLIFERAVKTREI